MCIGGTCYPADVLPVRPPHALHVRPVNGLVFIQKRRVRGGPSATGTSGGLPRPILKCSRWRDVRRGGGLTATSPHGHALTGVVAMPLKNASFRSAVGRADHASAVAQAETEAARILRRLAEAIRARELRGSPSFAARLEGAAVALDEVVAAQKRGRRRRS